MPVHVALSLSLFGSVALAGVLFHWADRVAGARLLIVFLLGVSAWIIGNELPTWAGEVAEAPALVLIATAPLTSAAFLHFALVFCGRPQRRRWLGFGYGAGLIASLLAIAIPSGRFEPFAGVAFMATPSESGWAASAVWVALAALGQGVLARAFVAARGIDRRRIGAVIAASAWGTFCMAGYGIAALRLPVYPWPLLGLPLYPVILVYGILRYRVLVANAWARRALAWALMVGLAAVLAGGAGALAPMLPIAGGPWSSGAVAAASVLLLGGPLRRLASSLVYPGSSVSADDLRQWRDSLSVTETQDALAATASALLSRRLGIKVTVVIGLPARDDQPDPVLACVRQHGTWVSRLSGWEAAPPGPLRLAGLFADVAADQARRIDGLEASLERERERQNQARLAELGALAATVAHDIRNPLNIIGMAVALAAPEVRSEVAGQIERIARLADDLLDYASPWRIEARAIDLGEWVASAAGRYPGIALGPGLGQPMEALVDPYRMDRALGNLIENARAAGGRVAIEAECRDRSVRVHVCDDGPGIPPDIRDRLFLPFVSRRAGGTGLGLAIVAKIMQAHGGSVALTERPGWTTCFTLTVPAA
jgi:signal transduction histidine kinase